MVRWVMRRGMQRVMTARTEGHVPVAKYPISLIEGSEPES